MKKQFISIAILCSTIVLSPSLNAMNEAAVIKDEKAQANPDLTKATLKEFSSRLNIIFSSLGQIQTKVTELKKNEGEELTQEQQDKVALLTSKLPEITQSINTVRNTIKEMYPDSWSRWAAKWISSSIPPAVVSTDGDLFINTADTLGGLNIFIGEFNANLVTIKAQVADNSALLEKLSTIENSLKGIETASTEVITTLTPQATLAGMLSRLMGKLLSFSN
jgi:hypothetical protein